VQLGKFDFVHYDLMKHVYETFQGVFGDDIELQNFDYSNTAMGWFVLEYNYKRLGYHILFENDRLTFSVRIIDKEGYHTWLKQIVKETELKYGLTKENIDIAVRTLKTEMKRKNICFYISKDGKQYKKEQGIVTRIKYPFRG